MTSLQATAFQGWVSSVGYTAFASECSDVWAERPWFSCVGDILVCGELLTPASELAMSSKHKAALDVLPCRSLLQHLTIKLLPVTPDNVLTLPFYLKLSFLDYFSLDLGL